jgi:hypothetical protein
VDKLLIIGFIHDVICLDWLANVVMVEKNAKK